MPPDGVATGATRAPEVKCPEAVFVFRALEYFFVLQRANGIGVSGAPVICHAEASEFAILRIPLVMHRSIDEVDDVVDLEVGEFGQEFGVGGLTEARGRIA